MTRPNNHHAKVCHDFLANDAVSWFVGYSTLMAIENKYMTTSDRVG